MLWLFVEQFDDDLAHVVTDYKVLKEIRNFIHIRIRRRLMQILVANKLGDFLSWGPSYQKFENNCANTINIA